MKKPEDIKVRVLNLLDVAEYIAEQEKYHKTWSNDLLYEFEAYNDSAFYLQIDMDPYPYTQNVHMFFCGLVKYFDFKDKEFVMFWISW